MDSKGVYAADLWSISKGPSFGTGRGVTLKVEDVRAFTQLQRVASALDQPQVVEYWKLAPFLLNFMRQYKLKEKFREQAESHENRTNLAQLLEKANELLLPWNRIEAYERVEPGNARVRNLVRELDNSGAWQLLWMPPSLPSYQLGADYKRAADTGLTKRLVFSAWTVVPQALATLVSYEGRETDLYALREQTREHNRGPPTAPTAIAFCAYQRAAHRNACARHPVPQLHSCLTR